MLRSTGFILSIVLLISSTSYSALISSFSGAPPTIRNNGVTDTTAEIGYEFLAPSTGMFQITDLGFWDGPNSGQQFLAPPSDGLAQDVTVTLWDISGTALASATILQGTVGNEYAYATLPTPVNLVPGQSYRISGGIQAGGNAFVNAQSGTLTSMMGFSVDPAVRSSTVGNFPTNTFPQLQAFIGPNALLAEVPEPSSALALCTGMLMLGLLRRRK